MKRSLLAVLASSLLLGGAVAQGPARVITDAIGRVEAAPSGACNAAATHRIQCSGLLLVSNGPDLSTFEGQIVQLMGDVSNDGGCLTMAVDVVASTDQSTSIFAPLGFRPGRNVIFTTRAPAGSFVGYFCGEEGFLPLPFGLGSFLINPLTATYLGLDVSIGIAIRTIRIPNNQALIGMRPIFQTFSLQITPPSGVILNPTCFEIVQ